MIPLTFTIIYGEEEQWGRDEIYPDRYEYTMWALW